MEPIGWTGLEACLCIRGSDPLLYARWIVSQTATEQEWIGTAGTLPGPQGTRTIGYLYTTIRAIGPPSLVGG